MKPNKVVKFANIPQANKAVSKKFGDVKKISLFERSEFEIFSRRAFCVLMGQAPARAMGSGGRFKEGVIPPRYKGASPAQGNPSLKEFVNLGFTQTP